MPVGMRNAAGLILNAMKLKIRQNDKLYYLEKRTSLLYQGITNLLNEYFFKEPLLDFTLLFFHRQIIFSPIHCCINLF
jgi:hypothetical protein